MELTKAFSNKEDVAKFEKDYSEMNIQTEVISNFFNYRDDPTIKKLIDFRFTDTYFKAQFLVSYIAEEALTATFGKYDFTFEGNREYRNWILKFKDHLFVVPAKREIVFNGEVSESVIKVAMEFEEAFTNFCFDYALNNKEKLNKADQRVVEDLTAAGIIKVNKINPK